MDNERMSTHSYECVNLVLHVFVENFVIRAAMFDKDLDSSLLTILFSEVDITCRAFSKHTSAFEAVDFKSFH